MEEEDISPSKWNLVQFVPRLWLKKWQLVPWNRKQFCFISWELNSLLSCVVSCDFAMSGKFSPLPAKWKHRFDWRRPYNHIVRKRKSLGIDLLNIFTSMQSDDIRYSANKGAASLSDYKPSRLWWIWLYLLLKTFDHDRSVIIRYKHVNVVRTISSVSIVQCIHWNVVMNVISNFVYASMHAYAFICHLMLWTKLYITLICRIIIRGFKFLVFLCFVFSFLSFWLLEAVCI